MIASILHWTATLSGILLALANVQEMVEETNHRTVKQEKQCNKELWKKVEEERKRAEEQRLQAEDNKKKQQEQTEKDKSLPSLSSSVAPDTGQKGDD